MVTTMPKLDQEPTTAPDTDPPDHLTRGARLEVYAASQTDELAWGSETGGVYTGRLREGMKTKSLEQTLSDQFNGEESVVMAQKGTSTELGERLYSQQSTDTAVGRSMSAPGGKQVGVYVANHDYDGTDNDMPGALGDARGMQSSVASKGYSTAGFFENLTGPQFVPSMRSALDAKKLAKGDEALLFYAGHGEKAGPNGVDLSVASYGDLLGMARSYTSKGVGVRFVLDCCNSGSMTDLVRETVFEEEAEQIAQDTGDVAATGVQHAHAADTLQQIKKQVGADFDRVVALYFRKARLVDAGKRPRPAQFATDFDYAVHLVSECMETCRFIWEENYQDLWNTTLDELDRAYFVKLDFPRSLPSFFWPYTWMDKMDTVLNQLVGIHQSRRD